MRFARNRVRLRVLPELERVNPQVRAALNLPTDGKNHHFINAAVFNFFHSVDKSAPLNRGMVRPVRVTIPRGTIINPEKYAAVGVRFATAVRVMDIIIAALSLAIDSSASGGEGSGILPAAGSGMLCPITRSSTSANASPRCMLGNRPETPRHEPERGRHAKLRVGRV